MNNHDWEKIEEIEDKVDDLKEEFNKFRSEVEARHRYEEIAKEQSEKNFNRNIAIATILITVFGIVLPILINLLTSITYRQNE